LFGKEKTRRLRRALGLVAAALGLCLLAVVVVLRLRFHGPELAKVVAGIINKDIRGSVQVRSVEWPLWRLPGALVVGWLPVDVYGVQVKDEFGEVVLTAEHARAQIDLHPFLRQGFFYFRDIEIPHGGYALIKEVTEPYPVHPYDRTVVSLQSAFYSRDTPSFQAGVSASPGTIFDLQSYRVNDATLEFRFPQFQARAEGVQGSGFLLADMSDPLESNIHYSLTPTARKAQFRAGPVELDLRDLRIERLSQLADWPRDHRPRDLRWAATATTVEGTQIDFRGTIFDFWASYLDGEYDATLRIDDAGPLAEKLSGGIVSGDAASLRIDLTGPLLGPRYAVQVSQLDLEIPLGGTPLGADQRPLVLHLPRASAGFDRATDAGYLDSAVAEAEGGRVELSATFSLAPNTFDLHVKIPQPISLARFVPPQVARLAGSDLRGRLHVFGNRDIQELDDLDLWLGRAHVTGKLVQKNQVVHADALSVTLGKSRVSLRSRGVIDLARRTMDLPVAFVSSDLSHWLRKLGAPVSAGSASGTGRISRSLSAPRIDAAVAVDGLPAVERARAELSYENGVLDVQRAEGAAFGGRIEASGKLAVDRQLRIVASSLRAVGLDLARLPGVGHALRGQLNLDARLSGPLKRPVAEVNGAVPAMSIAADGYRDVSFTLSSEADGSRAAQLHVEREVGGVLDLHATLGPAGQLGGVVSLRALPLESLARLADRKQAPVGGVLDAELLLGGTRAAPTAEGTVSLVRGWFQRLFLGTAQLEVTRAGDGQIAVVGTLLQDRLRIEGTISTLPPFQADLRMQLRRVELDALFPGLAQSAGVRGWVSGKISWRAPLLPVPSRRPEALLELEEVVALVDNEDSRGRPAPVRLRTRNPFAVHFDGQTARLLDEVTVSGPMGDFTLAGSGSVDKLALSLRGTVSLELLGPYLRQFFDATSGALRTQIQISGSLARPWFSGVIEVQNVAVKLTGQDALVAAPAGKIEFTNEQLSVTGLSIHVADELTRESSVLTLSGGVRMQGFQPTLWALRVSGDLSGKLLSVLAHRHLSSASGRADLSLALFGAGRSPNIDGTLVFNPRTPFTFTPRGLRREISLHRGIIKFTDQLIELERIRGRVDDEGLLTDISGEMGLRDWQPVDLDVIISAESLPFRVPQTLDLTTNLRNLRIVGGSEGLEISGLVEVIDGRYLRKFNPVLDALRPERSTEPESLFKDFALLASADLNLLVYTRAFYVANNVADIAMNGSIEVTGTPANPRFNGQIRVEDGSFKFQGIRARFSRTSGSVNFDPLRRFPDDTPSLDLRSESDYRDVSGQDHMVVLELSGPLGNLNWDLYTSTGLNKAQAFTLIFSGRTPEEARELIGDEPIARSSADFDSAAATTAETDSSLYLADQLFKDLAGDLISLLVEDSIRNVTNLDVARLEVGTATAGFHVEKHFSKTFSILGDLERSLRGWTWGARGEYRVTDPFSLESEVLVKRFDDDTAEDESNFRLKGVLRFLFP
jgi:hypothetical protein